MNLLEERLNRGLSVDEAARQAGVHAQTLRRAEKGKHMPRPADAKRIADFYGVKVTEIWPVEERVA